MQQQGRIELEAGNAHDAGQPGLSRDHPEGGKHLEVALVAVLQLRFRNGR